MVDRFKIYSQILVLSASWIFDKATNSFSSYMDSKSTPCKRDEATKVTLLIDLNLNVSPLTLDYCISAQNDPSGYV